MKHAFPASRRLYTRFAAMGAAVCGFVGTAVFADANCVSPPAGLVSWWRAEGNGRDAAGIHEATLLAGAGFTNGLVGQAFRFDGVDDRVIVSDAPDLNFGTGQDFSIEAWIQAFPAVRSYGVMTILDKRHSVYDECLGIGLNLQEGKLAFQMADAPLSKNTSYFVSPAPNLHDGQWHHVAVTVERNSVTGSRLYVDGQPVLIFDATQQPGDLSNSRPLRIGNHDDETFNCYFNGAIDEVGIYRRALSPSEIQTICNAGSAGKCATPTPPTITTQPANQTVVVGETATFTVAATGTTPLSYQWLFNGTNLAGATLSTLALSGTQPTQAGNYSVLVTNAYGAIASSNAILTVNPLPCVAPPAGLISWWRAEASGIDQTGGNDGARSGDVSYAAGQVGPGFSFDGNADAVSVGTATNLRLQNFTIEAWIQRASASAVTYFWDGGAQLFGGGSGAYNLAMSSDGQLFLGKVDITLVQSGVAITDTNFHHVAVTKSGSAVVFYVDGGAYPAAAFNTTFTFSSGFAIGARADNQGNSFLGTIDELAVYNRALTAAEVQDIHDAGSAGKCTTAVPPSIFAQPTNQTVVAGDTASFSVVASGTMPLSYQWAFNGTNMNGATQSVFVLPGVQPAQAGAYSVQVTNAFGATTSSNAMLTVNLAPSCAAPPAGLVSWWRGEGNGLDHTAGNDSTLVNQAKYVAARVGQGFAFDGSGDLARIGSATNLWLQNFTIEAWIKRASVSAVTFFFDGAAQLFGCGTRGYNLAMDSGGKLFLGKVDISLVQPTAAITDTNWHHVAVAKSGSTVVFYIDGVAYSAPAFNVVFEFPNTLAIGARPDTLGNSFLGAIDEVGIYSRALAATEIQAIYSSGNSGKCMELPPSIFVQPTSQTASSGDTVAFTVLASGARPLSYQWLFNGTNIGGATLATLTLPDVQPAQAGEYSVQVTNAFGVAVSSNALLTVNPPPPCTEPAAGLISWWRGEGNGQDFAGNNSGTPTGDTIYTVGKVGQAFSLNGVNQFVEVPHSASLNPTGSFSIEAWVFPTQDREGMIVCKWGDSGDYENNRSYQFTLHTGRSVGFHLSDYDNQWVSSFHDFQTTNAAITLNAWNHVAGVYDQPSGTRRLYVNGVKVAERVHAPVPVYGGTAKLGIGAVFRSSTTTASLFYGLIDEPTLVGRALTDTEIQAIYGAQSAGKCAVAVPPFFASQPSNKFALAGSPVTLAAVTGGTPPLTYQWTLNGTNLPGATTNTLSLPSVTSANAGFYNLVVTNGSTVGAITSAPAFLDVRYALAYATNMPLFGSNYTFIGSAELTLSSVFPSANTFYTLDGSAPSYASRYYGGPLTVTRSSWLRFITYSADFLQSWEAPPLSVIIIPTYPVTANTLGGGTVGVTPPAGPYVSNATVTVTATPASGWTFLQWQGDASGTNPSVPLTVNRPQRLEALFGTTLGTSIAGNGALQVYPNLALHPYGTVARLTAIPQAGSSFAVWGNAASGNVNPLAFPITNPTPTVSCLFAPLAAGQHALATVADGFGWVTVNPRANTYAAQTGVTLTAIPDPGQDFVGWSGDAAGTENPLTLTMDASKTVTAQFTHQPSLAVEATAEWLDTAGCRLTLAGEVGVYQVETSTNLTDWAADAVLTNTYGRVQFNDLTATNSPNQFYRARQSP